MRLGPLDILYEVYEIYFNNFRLEILFFSSQVKHRTS